MRLRRLTALLAVAAPAAAGGALVVTGDQATGQRAGAPATRVAAPGGTVPAAAARPAAARAAHHRRARRNAQQVRWRRSAAVGTPNAGALRSGVALPAAGADHVSLDPVRWTLPNPLGRRYGTARLVRTVLRVVRDHRRAHPGASRVVVGDLSLRHGGPFDARHGIVGEFGPGNGTLGHVSHQNGLDVDIYYPRRDGREHGPRRLDQVDRARAQDLVDRFVEAGAQFVFVGPRVGLHGPTGVVQVAARHDDHLHVRLGPGG